MPRMEYLLEVEGFEVYVDNVGDQFEFVNVESGETRGDGLTLSQGAAVELAEFILSKTGRRPVARG